MVTAVPFPNPGSTSIKYSSWLILLAARMSLKITSAAIRTISITAVRSNEQVWILCWVSRYLCWMKGCWYWPHRQRSRRFRYRTRISIEKYSILSMTCAFDGDTKLQPMNTASSIRWICFITNHFRLSNELNKPYWFIFVLMITLNTLFVTMGGTESL